MVRRYNLNRLNKSQMDQVKLRRYCTIKKMQADTSTKFFFSFEQFSNVKSLIGGDRSFTSKYRGKFVNDISELPGYVFL